MLFSVKDVKNIAFVQVHEFYKQRSRSKKYLQKYSNVEILKESCNIKISLFLL